VFPLPSAAWHIAHLDLKSASVAAEALVAALDELENIMAKAGSETANAITANLFKDEFMICSSIQIKIACHRRFSVAVICMSNDVP
jgi:hypothetical protein